MDGVRLPMSIPHRPPVTRNPASRFARRGEARPLSLSQLSASDVIMSGRGGKVRHLNDIQHMLQNRFLREVMEGLAHTKPVFDMHGEQWSQPEEFESKYEILENTHRGVKYQGLLADEDYLSTSGTYRGFFTTALISPHLFEVDEENLDDEVRCSFPDRCDDDIASAGTPEAQCAYDLGTAPDRPSHAEDAVQECKESDTVMVGWDDPT